MAHFSIPEHVYIGKNALEEAFDLIAKLGAKAFIVTGKHTGKSSAAMEFKSLLDKNGLSYVVFDNITGEPTVDMIEEGLSAYRSSGCSYIVGIGGGSPLDSAKAIAAMSANVGSISDFVGKEITGDLPPIVAIPTTAGTGSETTKFTVITDTKTDVKMLLKGEALIPKIAILNPEYTLDMPASVTASTGMDALTHAVEAYTSQKASELTDVYAVSAIKRIIEYLPRAYSDGSDKKAREQMLIAAYEAGVCINNSSVTIVHGMSRPIGALFHVAHGMSNAMLIEKALGFAAKGAYEVFGTLSKELGLAADNISSELATGLLLNKISEVRKAVKIPSLKEYGIDEEAFLKAIDKMSEDAVASGSPGNTIRTVTPKDCAEIYKEAYYME